MILTCPNCGTQYVVKDGAVPPEGRQVRCAACKHSWHQEPEATIAENPEAEMSAAPAAEEPPADGNLTGTMEPAEVDAEDESFADATLIEPRSGPEAEERAYEESVIDSGEAAAEDLAPATTSTEPAVGSSPGEAETSADWDAPPQAEAAPDDFSPFASSDDVEERRRSPMTTMLIVVLVIVALAAALWFFAPLSLKAKLGLAAAGNSPLQVSNPPHIERLQLASGNELLTVSGRVINPSAKEQEVPPLEAKLTTSAGKLVYRWTIPPPTRALAAGTSASFNSAEVNVPPGGEYLTITVGSSKA
jgi:predicted Zn finger-like uncharacterized protein